MLFTSPEFVFVFLPITFLGFWLCSTYGGQLTTIAWLTAASLAFYAYWDVSNLWLLIPSILGNYAAGQAIASLTGLARRALAALAIAANLGVLAYFKYTGFLVANFEAVTGTALSIGAIGLPLGVSFITFQKIAYIADVYVGKVPRRDPLRFGLFVSFFPQLIAGPISHHREILPQLAQRLMVRGPDVAAGLSLFAAGLFKKVVLADGVASIADTGFKAAANGSYLSLEAVWASTLAYTVQLYFDFSGYCDMACGLALLFGMRLPMNFFSPYKAANIIDFWRRWHMTLSRFLRDYLYIPLGGNRKGFGRRWFNLLVTMTLGGLWHGAGWTFVLWGAYHGGLLIINHAFHSKVAIPTRYERVLHPAFVLVTFLAVLVGWVLFRADNVSAAGIMLQSMIAAGPASSHHPFTPSALEWAKLAVALAIVWFMPNTFQVFAGANPALGEMPDTPRTWLKWRPSPAWVALSASALAMAMLPNKTPLSFLYFQF